MSGVEHPAKDGTETMGLRTRDEEVQVGPALADVERHNDGSADTLSLEAGR